MAPVPHPTSTQPSRLRRWSQTIAALTLGGLALFSAPAAQALETIQLKPSFLLEKPLTLGELEAFVEDGEKTDDIQLLLDLMGSFSPFGEDDIRSFFSNNSEVDGPLVDRFLSSFVGEVMTQEIAIVLDPKNANNPAVWEAFQGAVKTSAADNEISVLEVLRNYELSSLEVDVRRFSKLQQRISKDVEDFQALAGVEFSDEFSQGLDQLVCTPDARSSEDLMNLINGFSTSVNLGVEEALAHEVAIKSPLLDRFLTSFFGEITLRRLTLILYPNGAPGKAGEVEAAMQKAISQAGKDGQFSIMEALQVYKPNAVDQNVELLSGVVTRIQGDIRDMQSLLDLDDTAELSTILQELLCTPDDATNGKDS